MVPVIVSIAGAFWLARESNKRERNDIFWGFLGFFFDFLAIGIFLIIIGQRKWGIASIVLWIVLLIVYFQMYFS